MSARRVAMQMLDTGERADAARAALGEALGPGTVGEPDAQGIFDVGVDAEDQEAALARVWDAVAAAGADDHIAFAEHPSVSGHWKRKDDRSG